MITVNERWSFERDKWCWVLIEKIPGFNIKTKEPTITDEETYHRTLEQVCKYIIDKEAGRASEISSLAKIISDTHKMLERLLNNIGNK